MTVIETAMKVKTVVKTSKDKMNLSKLMKKSSKEASRIIGSPLIRNGNP